MRKPDACAPDSTAIRRCSDECAYSTTGDWNSGSLAFAISHGPYGTAPLASSSVSSFSDMLFSPPAFAFRSIGWPRSISSELLLTESEIQPRVPRRTVVPAISSSLSNALFRTRFHHYQLLAMDFLVAFRMEQYQVVGRVAAAVRSPNKVMGMPSRQFGNLLAAGRTHPLLFSPEKQ